MSQLIDDLLAFSRIGRTHMSRAPIDLNALVKNVIAELQPEIRNRKVEWRLEQLPYISGDRALLHQVLTNLLANAMKYTRTRAEAHMHSANDFEGTGVGLANVRRIVQRHGGRTWSESVLNEGATFYFSLPTPDKTESRMAAPPAETVAVPLRSAENEPGPDVRPDDA
jgi:signal transduction histidine kinase